MRASSELEEVEMEDLEENILPDIDSFDSKNLLVDYVEDIYKFYRQAESSSCVSPNYMSDQIDVNEKMRAILIDWLIEVHYKFELMDQTLFLTVNIIDRFLERQTVPRKKLQLVGVTAMLLACKYEEVRVPVVEDLVLISDRAYTREQVLEMERLIANTLQFKMSVPTPYVFMRRFLKAVASDKNFLKILDNESSLNLGFCNKNLLSSLNYKTSWSSSPSTSLSCPLWSTKCSSSSLQSWLLQLYILLNARSLVSGHGAPSASCTLDALRMNS